MVSDTTRRSSSNQSRAWLASGELLDDEGPRAKGQEQRAKGQELRSLLLALCSLLFALRSSLFALCSLLFAPVPAISTAIQMSSDIPPLRYAHHNEPNRVVWHQIQCRESMDPHQVRSEVSPSQDVLTSPRCVAALFA